MANLEEEATNLLLEQDLILSSTIPKTSYLPDEEEKKSEMEVEQPRQQTPDANATSSQLALDLLQLQT